MPRLSNLFLWTLDDLIPFTVSFFKCCLFVSFLFSISRFLKMSIALLIDNSHSSLKMFVLITCRVMVETSLNKFDAYHPSLPSLLNSMLAPRKVTSFANLRNISHIRCPSCILGDA